MWERTNQEKKKKAMSKSRVVNDYLHSEIRKEWGWSLSAGKSSADEQASTSGIKRWRKWHLTRSQDPENFQQHNNYVKPAFRWKVANQIGNTTKRTLYLKRLNILCSHFNRNTSTHKTKLTKNKRVRENLHPHSRRRPTPLTANWH